MVRCPVNVLITRQSDGRRIGSRTNEPPVNEFEDGFCETEVTAGDKFWRFGLPDGEYDIQLYAYANGKTIATVINSKTEDRYDYPEIRLWKALRGSFIWFPGKRHQP